MTLNLNIQLLKVISSSAISTLNLGCSPDCLPHLWKLLKLKDSSVPSYSTEASPRLDSLASVQDPSTLHPPCQPCHPLFLNCFLALSPIFTLALLPTTLLMVASVCSYKCQLDQVNPCHIEDRTQRFTWTLRHPADWSLPTSPHSLPSYSPSFSLAFLSVHRAAPGPLHKLFYHLNGFCLSAISQLKCHSFE